MRKISLYFLLGFGLIGIVFEGRPALSEDAVLVFSGWNFDNKSARWDLYRTSLSGESKILVTSNLDETYAFAFPDGKSVGYLVETPGREITHIHRVDIQSGATQSLDLSLNVATRCQVSPDQKKLACDDNIEGHSQVVVFDLETKQKKQITYLHNDCQDPSWSPDMKNLVYWTGGGEDRVGKESKPRGNHLAIYNFETGENHLLTRENGAYDAYPHWSNDGQWIAFHRKGKSRGVWNIWMIHPDGTEATQLTDGKYENTYASWSPDSKQIAFQCYRPDPDAYDICAVEVATKRAYSITNTKKVDERQPIWLK
jgi:Tol biopolymer transport system component